VTVPCGSCAAYAHIQIQTLERILGSRHPDTLTARAQLARFTEEAA
jgi:hypothetical protein